MKVLQVGSFPPPYGGVSVHIKRMKVKLENLGKECKVINCDSHYNNPSEGIYKIGNIKLLLRVIIGSDDIIHIHTANKKIRILSGFLTIINKKVILTAHSENLNDQINNSNPILKKIFIYSLKKVDGIVCVNNEIYNKILKLGIEEKKIHYIPAYIEPTEMKKDFENIPEEVWGFINSSEFLISGNGNIRFYNNEDLYGLDLSIDLIDKLRKLGYNVKLIFAVLAKEEQNEREKKYYKSLKDKIDSLGLQEHIYLYEVKDSEFYPILKHTNIFIRPTNTDGFPLSLAEALKYKVPAIASDVCNRPKGTFVFKSREIDSLLKITKCVIENYSEIKLKMNFITGKDYFNEIYELYNRISNK